MAAAWLDPRTRGMAEDPLRRLWNGAKAFGVAFTSGLGKMFSGAIESLAMTLGNFIGGGGVRKALAALGSVLTLAGKTFIASVKTIFDAFPYRLRASLGLLLDRLPGVDTGVTRQRDAFLKPVYERIIRYPGEDARHAARDLGITADEYRQLRRQLLESANRHSEGRQFKSLLEIDELRRTGMDPAAARAWRHITGEGYLDKFYRRNFGLFLKHTGGADNPLSHFAGIPQQMDRVLADMGQLFTVAAGSVETGPLRKAASEAADGLKQAFASGVAPALESGRNLADYRAGKAGRYEYLRANYGENAAEQWAAPYWEWRSKYPNGQRWNMKEYYRDRAEAARKQKEIFNGITSPKPQEERKRREEEQKARNRQEEQLASMQHTLDRLERALAPIARAYA